jgi:hypothetical protein
MSGGMPITPMPQPSMEAEESHYAGVEGVTVWEGPVQELGETLKPDFGLDTSGSRGILKRKGRWEVTYKGQVPVGESSSYSTLRRATRANWQSVHTDADTKPRLVPDSLGDTT